MLVMVMLCRLSPSALAVNQPKSTGTTPPDEMRFRSCKNFARTYSKFARRAFLGVPPGVGLSPSQRSGNFAPGLSEFAAAELARSLAPRDCRAPSIARRVTGQLTHFAD